ncbi:MAG TPA: flippase-like domain-containing protein [Thermoplasmata archaeon]|nr:flippase-like domain-containing protein [Thermoplasmata archaeon]
METDKKEPKCPKKELSGLFVAVILILILLSQIPFSTLYSTLTSVNPFYLLLGFCLYLTTYLLRALRFKVILENIGEKVRITDLLKVLFIHNMVNQILPARTGEISYIYLMEKRNLPVNKGISSLALARIFDLVGVTILFMFALIVLREMNPIFFRLFTIMLMVVGMALFSLLCLFIYKNKFIEKVESLTEMLRLHKFSVTKKALEKSEEAIEDLKIIKSKKVFIYSTLLSIGIWFTGILLTYLLLAQMDVMLSIWEVCLGSLVIVITSILPIHSFGGFGTTETIWASIYIALGVSKEMAIASGIGVHLIVFAYLLIIGVAGVVLMKIEGKEIFKKLRGSFY